MTLKEKILQIDPELANPNERGGVRGCPPDYEELGVEDGICFGVTGASDKNCEDCWNREFVEKKITNTDNRDETVNHPSHYNQGGVECIDAIKAAVSGLDGFEGFCSGNAIKYLFRWKHKNGLEDLKKCQWYLDKLVEECVHCGEVDSN